MFASLVVVDSRFKAKHSLDSDEEDEVKESSVMDEEEIEGQEDSTVVGVWVGGVIQLWSVRTREGDRQAVHSSFPLCFRLMRRGSASLPST